MKEVRMDDKVLQMAAEKGYDEFVSTITQALLDAIGGELNGENMMQLNADQITLLAYHYLHEEVMEGGFVQLIHNGLGSFIFLNPTGKAFREWGLQELFKILGKTHRLYSKYHAEIERDCDDETFMAMYEQFAEFDEFDEQFVENEELFTRQIARYVDHHLDHFVVIAHE